MGAIVQEKLPLLAAEVAARRMAPKDSVLKLLTAVWHTLGYRKEELADAGAADAAALAWPVARTKLGAEFAGRLASYDPTVPAVVFAFQKGDVLKGMLGEVAADDVAKTSAVLPALLGWCKATVEARDAAGAKRKREAEEAEAAAKAKAEAEAAAKAAAEGGGEE
jgi:hypothetical protein